MKFLRHLSAVMLAVAAVVGLGMLWAHASGGGTAIGSGLTRAPSREAPVRLEQTKAGMVKAHSGNGFDLAGAGDLIRTCVIEAVLAAIVVAVSSARRRHRRRRHGGTLPGARSGVRDRLCADTTSAAPDTTTGSDLTPREVTVPRAR